MTTQAINYKLVLLPNPILVSDEEYEDDDKAVWVIGGKVYKIVAGVSGVFNLDISLVAGLIGYDIWRVGNKVKITTIFDWEKPKPWPNHKEWENLGKQEYIGKVVRKNKGLALKLDNGDIFELQGNYWFGSVLQQKCELISGSPFDSKKYTEEDMIMAAKYGYEFRHTTSFPNDSFEESCVNNFRQFLQSKSMESEIFDVDIEKTMVPADRAPNGWDISPNITDNTIKVTKIL